jgi:hypothetical protein
MQKNLKSKISWHFPFKSVKKGKLQQPVCMFQHFCRLILVTIHFGLTDLCKTHRTIKKIGFIAVSCKLTSFSGFLLVSR